MDNTPINQHLKNMSIMPEMLMFPFQAESTAFWVAGMLGLDTGDYSFGYITGWSKDRERFLMFHRNITKQVLRIDRRVKHQDFVYISRQDILMQRQVIKQSSV